MEKHLWRSLQVLFKDFAKIKSYLSSCFQTLFLHARQLDFQRDYLPYMKFEKPIW